MCLLLLRLIVFFVQLGWMSLENRIIEKKLISTGRVASLEAKNWTRQAWNMAEEKRLPWANRFSKLVGLRNRTGRTAQDKTFQKCKEWEVENEHYMVLKCPAYRVERNRMWYPECWGR